MLDKFLLEVGHEREKQASDRRSRHDLGMDHMSVDELLKLAAVTAPTPPGPPKVDGSSGATPEDIGAAVGAALKVVKDREAEQAAMAEEEAAAQEEEAQAQQNLEGQAADANQPDPNLPPTFPPGQEPRQPPPMDPAAGGAPPAADPAAGGAGEVKQAFRQLMLQKQAERVSRWEGLRASSRAQRAGSGLKRLLPEKRLMKENLKEVTKGTLKGGLTGGVVGTGVGGLAGGILGRDLRTAGMGAAVGGLGGAMLGQEVGGSVGQVKAHKAHLDRSGISGNVFKGYDLTPEAKKKYLDDWGKKEAGVVQNLKNLGEVVMGAPTVARTRPGSPMRRAARAHAMPGVKNVAQGVAGAGVLAAGAYGAKKLLSRPKPQEQETAKAAFVAALEGEDRPPFDEAEKQAFDQEKAFGRAKRASIENAFTGAGAAAGLGTTALLQRRAAHHDSMMRDTGQMDRKTHWKRKAKRLGGLAVGTGAGAALGRGALEFGREVDPHIKDYAKSWGPTIDETVKPVHDRLTSTGGSLAAGFVPTESLKKKVREALRNKEAEPREHLSMNTLSTLGGAGLGLAGTALAQRKGRYHDRLMRDTGHMDQDVYKGRKAKRTMGLMAGTAAGAGLGRGALEVGRSLDHHTKNYVKDWGQAAAVAMDPAAERFEDIAGNISHEAIKKTLRSPFESMAEAWKNRRVKKAYADYDNVFSSRKKTARIYGSTYDDEFMANTALPYEQRKGHYISHLGRKSKEKPSDKGVVSRTGGTIGGLLGAGTGVFLGGAHSGTGALVGAGLGGLAGGALGVAAGRAYRRGDIADIKASKRLLGGSPEDLDTHIGGKIHAHVQAVKAQQEWAEWAQRQRERERHEELLDALGGHHHSAPSSMGGFSSPSSQHRSDWNAGKKVPIRHAEVLDIEDQERKDRDRHLSNAESIFKSKPAPRSDPDGPYSHWAKDKRPSTPLPRRAVTSTSSTAKPKYPTSHAGRPTSQKEWEDADKEINDLMDSKGLKHAFVHAALRAVSA